MKINIQAIINSSTKAQLQGLVSRGIKEAELDDNGHLIFTLTDNSTVDIGRVEGDPGKDGASIVAITKGQTVGDTTTYIITMSDGNEFYFEVKTAKGDPGEPGADGADGTTFTPAVSAEGVISWTNDGGKVNPPSVNIKGVPGADGADGADGQDGITPTIGNNGNWYLGATDTGKPSRGEQGIQGPPGQDGSDADVTEENIIAALGYTPADEEDLNEKADASDVLPKPTSGLAVGKYFRVAAYDSTTGAVTLEAVDDPAPVKGIRLDTVDRAPDADGIVTIPIASGTPGVFKLSGTYGLANTAGYLHARGERYQDYLGVNQRAFISKGTLENVLTAYGAKPNIKTAMDAVAVAGAQYFLGQQSAVSIVLPNDAEVGQQISVVWYNGATAATLSITGTVLTVDYTPSANSRSEVNAIWDGSYWAVVTNEQAVSA